MFVYAFGGMFAVDDAMSSDVEPGLARAGMAR